MSKPAARIADLDTGHSPFPPSPIISGSPNVSIEGLPAARVGDTLAPHSATKHPPHERRISTGASNVWINGRPAALGGSAVSCGGTVIASARTVTIGTKPPPVPLVYQSDQLPWPLGKKAVPEGF